MVLMFLVDLEGIWGCFWAASMDFPRKMMDFGMVLKIVILLKGVLWFGDL